MRPPQSDDSRRAVVGRDLEERVLIQHALESHANVVRPALVARNQGEQALVAAVGIVRRVPAGRHLPDVIGQIAEELFDLLDRRRLILGHVVDDAADPRVNRVSSEVFLVDLQAQRGLDHRRPAGKDLARALGDHAEVAQTRHGGQTAGRRTEHGRDHRGDAEDLAEVLELAAVGNVGAAEVRELGHAATRPVDQVDHRQLQLQRIGMPVTDVHAAVVGPSRPAANREILTAHEHATTVHPGQPAHAADRCERDLLAPLVVG